MGKFVVLFILLIGIFTIFFAAGSNKQNLKSTSNQTLNQVENLAYKAAFAIFTNGTFRDFSDSRYHNLSEDVFLTAGSPNIVNVTKDGLTWDDFFKTLPMELGKDCIVTGTKQTFCSNETESLKFFINGKKDPDALDREMKEGDRLLVSFGSETDDIIDSQIKQVPDPK